MYVAPPHDCVVSNFRVKEITEVFQSRLEKTEETKVREDGCTSSIYELILSYMMHSYKYSQECMYLRKRKIIRHLWGIKATITETEHNKGFIFWTGDKSGNGEQLKLIKRTTRRCFLMRRVWTKGEHNKEEVWR